MNIGKTRNLLKNFQINEKSIFEDEAFLKSAYGKNAWFVFLKTVHQQISAISPENDNNTFLGETLENNLKPQIIGAVWDVQGPKLDPYLSSAKGHRLEVEGSQIDQAIAMAIQKVQDDIKAYTQSTKNSFWNTLTQKFKDFSTFILTFIKNIWSNIKNIKNIKNRFTPSASSDKPLTQTTPSPQPPPHTAESPQQTHQEKRSEQKEAKKAGKSVAFTEYVEHRSIEGNDQSQELFGPKKRTPMKKE